MNQIHKHEKEQFKKLFKQEHFEKFEDRFSVLDTFMQTEQHVTVTELVELLSSKGLLLTPDFVRETLNLLYQFGFAEKNRFDNGVVRYEHKHVGQHHDHMVCTRCRRIFEFRDDTLENLQIKIAATHGFHMLQHKMEIYGICSDCLKERRQVVPLSATKQGEQLIVKGFNGGANARMRLMTMGLRIGDKIEVITNLDKGQVSIAVDQKRYILGRGLAQKVLVEHIRS